MEDAMHQLTRYRNALLLKVQGPSKNTEIIAQCHLVQSLIPEEKRWRLKKSNFCPFRKDKQLTLKKLVKLNQIVGFLSEKYNDAESEEVIWRRKKSTQLFQRR